MCAIFGLGFQRGCILNPKDVKQTILKLATNCQASGRDATGIAFVTENKVTVVKHNVPAAKFIKTKEFHKAFDENVIFTGDRRNRPIVQIIGHCRAQTKGTHKHYGNNHPIVCKRLVGTHNGMISNDEELYRDFNLRRS